MNKSRLMQYVYGDLSCDFEQWVSSGDGSAHKRTCPHLLKETRDRLRAAGLAVPTDADLEFPCPALCNRGYKVVERSSEFEQSSSERCVPSLGVLSSPKVVRRGPRRRRLGIYAICTQKTENRRILSAIYAAYLKGRSGLTLPQVLFLYDCAPDNLAPRHLERLTKSFGLLDGQTLLNLVAKYNRAVKRRSSQCLSVSGIRLLGVLSATEGELRPVVNSEVPSTQTLGCGELRDGNVGLLPVDPPSILGVGALRALRALRVHDERLFQCILDNS